jgi:hypothetical protein
VAFVLKVSLLGLAAAGLLLVGLGLVVAGVIASDVEMGLLAFLWILAAPFVIFGSMLVRSIVRMTREQMTASRREPPGNASAAAEQPAPTPPAVPPGRYPDPQGMPCSRWWDGVQWTEATGPR